MMQNTNRSWIVLKRWRDVTVYGLLSLLAIEIIKSAKLVDFIPANSVYNSITQFAPLIFVFVVSFLFVFALGKVCKWGLKSVCFYPPYWLGVPIGLALVMVVYAYSAECNWEQSGFEVKLLITEYWGHLLLVFVFAVGVYLSYFGLPKISIKASQRVIAESKSELPVEYNAIVEWCYDDKEVTSADRDFFDHDAIATRIVGRFKEAIKNKKSPPTMALVGPYGSGKSTIRALVENRLQDTTDHPVMCAVSLWPYDSTEAAVSGILSTLLEKLGENADISALRGLPRRYVTAIEEVGGKWGKVLQCVQLNHKPEHVIKTIDEIAIAVDLHLLLWIEDLERFAGTERLERTEAASRERERLGAIRALLYLLDNCDRVSVIVADTSLDSRYDIHKIARYIEKPPKLVPYLVYPMLSEFYKGFKNERSDIVFLNDHVDKLRGSILPEEYGDNMRYISSITDRTKPTPFEAIVSLLNTPRELKAAVRLVHETWNKLAGEIDQDDVFAMTAIRLVAPDVFAIIERDIGILRDGFRMDGSINDDRASEEHSSYKELINVIGGVTNAVTRANILTLIRYVFPRFPDSDSRENPQGFAVVTHADYWDRYLALPDIADEDSDQAALKDILAWKKDRSKGVIGRLVDAEKSQQIESFGRMFVARDMCDLLEEVTSEIASRSKADWENNVYAPGHYAIHSMMCKALPLPATLFETIKKCITNRTGGDLRVIYSLLDIFATDSLGDLQLFLDREQCQKLHAEALREMMRSFPLGSGEKLVNSLDHAFHELVFSVVKNSGIEFCGSEHLRFEGWPVFSDVLLDAAEINANTVLPQLLFLISNVKKQGFDRTQRKDIYTAEFRIKLARELFDFERLVAVFAKASTPDRLDEPMSEMFSVVQAKARRYYSGVESASEGN